MPRHFREQTGEEQRATWLELFFDLVYVFAVTQLSHALLVDPTAGGLLRTAFLLLVVWWAWINTTWMANWFDPDAVPVRLVLIGGMLASLLMAVAVPHAFTSDGMLFAGALRGAPGRSQPVQRLGRRARLGVRAVVPPAARVERRERAAVDRRRAARRTTRGSSIWIVALVMDYAAPSLRYWTPGLGSSRFEEWAIEGAHFAERFQLFIIIALGESIVVTGATASDAGRRRRHRRGADRLLPRIGRAVVAVLRPHRRVRAGAPGDRGRRGGAARPRRVHLPARADRGRHRR